MNHIGTKVLLTERLILRKLKMSDAQDMFDNWASDDEVTKYLTWPTHASVQDAKDFISFLSENYVRRDFYCWGIELKEIGQVIGSISVNNHNDDIGSAHIGYCIGREWWRKGIASEAFSAVIEFLMKEVCVNRIESRHDCRNPHSGKVMEKCGLKLEGTLRQSDKSNAGIYDYAWYGLLRDEYLVGHQK